LFTIYWLAHNLLLSLCVAGPSKMARLKVNLIVQ
jgi:hypothetical protein